MTGNNQYGDGCAKTPQTMATRSSLRRSNSFLLTLLVLLYCSPTAAVSTSCSYNGNGDCMVSTDTDASLELLSSNNQSVTWKIRPQNIGFMYYLRTTDDGNDLSVRGIVKWKVQLKNWTPNDTVVEGFLVTIMDHDSNETVNSYELRMTEPFDDFAKYSDVFELRMQLDDVLMFDKRYDAKINILPIGKQAAASSFLSIMSKLEGEKCSAMTGLAERWAPHVMVDVFHSTSEVEIAWQPAPSFLCVKSYEIILQNYDGVILNTTEIEVTPGEHFVNASFGSVGRNQTVQVKVRGKHSTDGGCACVNCNCITDKTKFFTIPEHTRNQIKAPTTPSTHQKPIEDSSDTSIFFIGFGIVLGFFFFVCGCLRCRNRTKKLWKKQTALNAVKTSSSQFTNHSKNKTKKEIFKILLVCPDIEGHDLSYMTRIVEALKKSHHKIICDKWRDIGVEENILRWVNDETQNADKIIVFHSSKRQSRCGVYELIDNFFPGTDPRLAHVALSPNAQRQNPREVEFVLPRDQRLLEDAYDFEISQPLVIDIPNNDIELKPVCIRTSTDSIAADESPGSTKNHSTDSGVSSMSSNSSDSDGVVVEQLHNHVEVDIKSLNIESHPLLQQAIEV